MKKAFDCKQKIQHLEKQRPLLGTLEVKPSSSKAICRSSSDQDLKKENSCFSILFEINICTKPLSCKEVETPVPPGERLILLRGEEVPGDQRGQVFKEQARAAGFWLLCSFWNEVPHGARQAPLPDGGRRPLWSCPFWGESWHLGSSF